MLQTLLETGVRASELLLRVEDVSLRARRHDPAGQGRQAP